MSQIVVTGATGTIGRALVTRLRERGDHVIVLTRSADSARETLGTDINAVEWSDPTGTPAPGDALRGADGVINLMGEPIAQRWSGDTKERIRSSRVEGTANLVAAIRALGPDERPKVLVSQSAVGYYGPRGDEPLDETAGPGSDFLAEVVVAWEAAAQAAEADGLRVVETRTGVVLSETGGALAQMLPPFKAGVGGPVAGGRQYLPWIHLDDVVGGLLFALDSSTATGPINLTAPEPVTNKAFSKALGKVLHRPAIAPVPKLAIKALYGEMSVIVVTGQRAVPKRLTELGYTFAKPDLQPALADVLKR